MVCRTIVALLCAFLAIFPPLASAQEIDLGSAQQSHSASDIAGLSQTTIKVGNNTRVVGGADALTAAEFVAVNQVLATGRQTLNLSGQGVATGGSFAFSAIGNSTGTFAVPQNVMVLHNFAAGNIDLTGDLRNAGTIFAYSTNTAVQTASISALNILNQTSGLITSLPVNSFQSSLGGISGLNLSLSALGDIVNQGQILGDGSVSLASASGVITNGGIIESRNGSLNFSAAGTSNLVVNNVGGLLTAASTINMRDASYTGAAHTMLWGGDVLSRQLNLFSGSGVATIDVGQLSGILNINAGEAHVAASTSSLELGNICLSGDPTFFNRTGDVVINTSLSFAGAPLAIVAAKDIVTAPGAGAISTASGSGNGGDILLIAGANFDTSGSSSVVPPAPGDTATTLTVYGASVSGGKIDLSSGTAITSLTAASSAANGAGGDITLVSYSGLSVGSGGLRVPTAVTINASGNGSGANGNIMILASSPCTTCSLTAGEIRSTGGADNTGNITIASAVANVSAPITILNGAATGGSFSVGALQTGNIAVGNIFAQGGAIVLSSARNVSTGSITSLTNGTNAGTLALRSNSTTAFAIGGGGANGTGPVLVRGGTTAGDGGNLNVINNGTGGIAITAANLDLSPQAANGKGGIITLNSNTVFSNGTLDVSGVGTGGGGTITITSNSATQFIVGPTATTNGINGSLRANGGSGGGDGGTITITSSGAGNTGVASTIEAIGLSGKGGTVTLTGGSGTLSALGGTINASAGGSGAFDGGTITVTAPTIGGTGVLILQADAGGTGKGGTVSATSSLTTADLRVGNTAGSLEIFARGGSSGSAAGDGGKITLRSGRHLTINPTYLDGSPAGNNGTGAILELVASNGGTAGNLFVSNSMAANGVGTGSGGSIKLTAFGTAQFNIQGGAVTNGVNGGIQADAGALGGNGGYIEIQNRGTLGTRVSNPNQVTANASAAGGNGGTIRLAGGPTFGGTGVLTLGAGTLAVNGSGAAGNGGTILLSGSSISVPAGVNLQANGSGSGNGGNITVLSLSQTGTLRTGNGANLLNISATGGSAGSLAGNGGSVGLDANNNVTINPAFLAVAPLGTNGNGGRITAGAGNNFYNPYPTWVVWPGRILVTGSLDLSGVGIGNGGSVSLDSNSVSVLNIAPGEATNGVNGTIRVDGGATSGNGGSISLSNRRQQTFGTTVSVLPANISALASAGGGNGGTISIGSGLQSNVSLGAGLIDVSGRGNGNGGSVSVRFWDLQNIAGAPLVINADGAGTGNGGTISMNSIGAATITVGNGSGNLNLSAMSGTTSGNGGTISIFAGDELTVDPTYLNFAPQGTDGNGGRLSLRAGNGCMTCGTPIYRSANLFINNSLSADGVGQGNGGRIYLASNSVSPFMVGAGATTNGVNGVISAKGGPSGGDGGDIDIYNGRDGGGITVLDPSALNIAASPAGGHGGNLDLDSDTGTLTLAAGTYSADAAGPGDWDGGGFGWIAGNAIAVTGSGPVIWSANATGNGDGGYADFAYFANMTIGTGNGEHTIVVHGGSAGSTSGDGGYVYIEDIDNLTVNGAGVQLGPLGTNGYGGDFEAYDCNVTVNGDLNISGKGTDEGGYLGLYSGGTNATVVNGNIFANGGDNGGWGGYIDLENWGTGNITVNGSIHADGGAGGGGAGEYWLETDNGTFRLGPGAVMTANATSGDNDGGWIGFWGRNFVVTGGTATIQVDAFGSGDGGGIYIEPFGATSDLVVGSGGLTLLARGGSAGSTAGDGGYIELYAGRHLIVDTAYLDVGPRGVNGDGGGVYLMSAESGSGNLQINGSLNLNGVGTGDGGSVALEFNTANPFIVGGAVTSSGINGSISVDAPSTGAGGDIDFYNNAAAAMNIVLNGNLSASSKNTNRLGTITVSQPGQAVSMVGPGSITGLLNAVGSSVNISATGANSIVQINNVSASAGNATVIADGIGSSIFLPFATSNLSASGNVVIDTIDFASNGNTSGANIAITADSINYSCCGTLNAGAGTITLAPQGNTAISVGNTADSNGFVLSQAELSRTTAGTLIIGDMSKTGDITIAGTVDVSGAGAGAFDLVFNNAGTYVGTGQTINLGNRTLDINAGNGGYTGTVTGNNTVVTITTSDNFDVNQAVIVGATGTVNIVATAGSNAGINIGADIGGGSNTNLIADGSGTITRSTGTVTGTNVLLQTDKGAIGTGLSPVIVNADNLSVNAGGVADVTVNEVDSVNLMASSAGRNLFLSAGGNITTGGDLSAGTGTLGTLSLMSDGRISVGSNMTATNQIFLTTVGTGDVTVSAGFAASAGRTILVTANDIDLQGTLVAPVAIGLRTNGVKDMTVNDNADGDGDDGTFDVNAAELGQISTNQLEIGYQYEGGGLTLVDNLDVSARYNLMLLNQDNVTSDGFDITLGARTLTIQADQGLATTGTISGGNNVMVYGQDVIVNGVIAVNAGGSLDIESSTWSAFNGDVTLNAAVGGGANTFIYAAGTGAITQSAGVVTGTNVTFLADAGDIGAGAAHIQTNAGSLSINTGGTADAFVDQLSAVSLTSSGAGDEFYLSVNGNFTHTAAATISADDITLASAAGSGGTLILDASLTAASSITLIADGGGSIVQSAGTIASSNVVLQSGSGNIGQSAQVLNVAATTLSANTGGTGEVHINGGATVALNASSAGTIFELTAGTITRNGGGIAAQTVDLNASVGNIGAAGNAIQTTASSNISIDGLATSNVFVNNSGDATLDVVGPINNLTVNNTGALTSNGVISGAAITLNASSDLTVGDSISGSTITLSSGGNLAQSAGVLTAPNVSLTATGNVGSLAAPLITDTDTLTVNAGGDAYVDETSAVNLAASTVTGLLWLDATAITTTAAVNAGSASLTTGSIANNFAFTSTGAVTVASPGALTISGSGSFAGSTIALTSGGAVSFSQNTIGGVVSGTSVNNFDVTASASGLSVDTIASSAGSIALAAMGGDLSVVDDGALTALNNVQLRTNGNVAVGNNVTMDGGQLAPGEGAVFAILNANTVLNNGSISIDNYLGGTGTGDITFGNGVALTSRGGAGGVAGSIGVLGAVDITGGANLVLTAWGGDIWLSAGDDLTLGNAQLNSIAKLDDGGAMRAIPGAGGQLISAHTGGRIGLYAGLPWVNMGGMLDGKVDTRTGNNIPVYPGMPAYNPAANLPANISGGGLLEIWLNVPGGSKSTITGNLFDAQGGVIIIDPPDPGNTVGLTGGAFLALAPALALPPPPPPPPPAVVVVTPVLPAIVIAPPPAPAPVAPTIPTPLAQQPIAKDTTRIDATFNTQSSDRYCTPTISLGGSGKDVDENGYHIAAGACQSFAIDGESGAMAIGDRGTTLGQSTPDKLSMKQGRMVVVTKQTAVTVDTEQGSITVPAESTMIVEQRPSGVMRVANLDGKAADVSLKANGGVKVISAQPGEEVVIADVGVSDEELIPVDGVERVAVNATLSVAHKQVKKNTFDRSRMIASEPMLNCHGGCFSLPMSHRLEKLRKQHQASTPISITLPAQPLSTYAHVPAIVSPNSHLQPIAHATPVLPSRVLQVLSTPGASIKHDGQAKIDLDGQNVVSIHNGEAVLVVRKPVSLKSGNQTVHVKPGTILSIDEHKGILKVRNLFENAAESVTIVLGSKKSIAISAGQELVVGPDHNTIASALRHDSTGRRRIKAFNIPGKESVITAEVSMVSLLNDSNVLSRLLNSAKQDDQELAKKIMKMSVCLGVATGGHGAYSSGFKN